MTRNELAAIKNQQKSIKSQLAYLIYQTMFLDEQIKILKTDSKEKEKKKWHLVY